MEPNHGTEHTGAGNLNSPLPQTPNYFIRHWRGDLSLPIAYWVNLFLISAVLIRAVAYALDPLASRISLRALSVFVILYISIGLVAWVWGIVGVWRSADLHKSRGGLQIWATLAKVAVILGALGMAGNLHKDIIPTVKEFLPLVIGHDALGEYTVRVLPSGKEVYVRGVLREGSASAIIDVLQSAPTASTVILASEGGRLLEAQILAEYIRSRKLNTYVEDVCFSACTVVFLSGADRAALAKAKIGFHAPASISGSPALEKQAFSFMKKLYADAGLPATFIDRALSTKEGWFPTRQELIQAKVLTRVALNRETTLGFSRFGSKEELVLVLREVAVFRAIETRYPDIFAQAIENGWQAKIAGGNDGQVSHAVRSQIANIPPLVLATGSDETREQFLRLMLAQLRALQKLDAKACALFLDSALDVNTILPKEIVDMEVRWLLEALSADTPKGKPRSQRVTQSALQSLRAQLAPDKLRVIQNLEEFNDQPSVTCDAFVSLYSALEKMPKEERRAALEGMFVPH